MSIPFILLIVGGICQFYFLLLIVGTVQDIQRRIEKSQTSPEQEGFQTEAEFRKQQHIDKGRI